MIDKLPDFAKMIKERRKALKMTQEEFANAYGVKRTTIVMIEGGKHNPSGMLVWKLLNDGLEECPKCSGRGWIKS